MVYFNILWLDIFDLMPPEPQKVVFDVMYWLWMWPRDHPDATPDLITFDNINHRMYYFRPIYLHIYSKFITLFCPMLFNLSPIKQFLLLYFYAHTNA